MTVIANSGHWLMEEQPQPTIAAIRSFLSSREQATMLRPTRLDATQIDALGQASGGAGTSELHGVQTMLLSGDPNAPGPYALEIRVPAHTRIAAPIATTVRRSLFPANGISATGWRQRKRRPSRWGRAVSTPSPRAWPILPSPAMRRRLSTSPDRAQLTPNMSGLLMIPHANRKGKMISFAMPRDG